MPTRATGKSSSSITSDGFDSDRKLRVLTLNVFPGSPVPFGRNHAGALRGSERFSDLVSLLCDTDHDVICLQEVFNADLRRELARAMGSQYVSAAPIEPIAPHVGVPTGAWILRFAWFVAVWVCLFLFGRGLVGEFETGPSAGTVLYPVVAALLRYSMSSPTGQWVFDDSLGFMVFIKIGGSLSVKTPFMELPFTEQGGDPLNHIHKRGFMVGELFLDADHSRSICLVNAHLNAFGESSSRAGQATEILTRVISQTQSPTLICADANEGRDGLLMSFIRTSIGTPHTAELPSWSASTNRFASGWLGSKINAHVDYIIDCDRDRKRLRVGPCNLAGTTPPVSDHYGVSASVYLLDN